MGECHNKNQQEKCCCRCVFRKPVYGHPWVNGESISTLAHYACTVLNEIEGGGCDGFILSNEHSVPCEMFTQNKQLKLRKHILKGENMRTDLIDEFINQWIRRGVFPKKLDKVWYGKRNRQILQKRFADGKTLKRIADDFKISSERVKQIIHKYIRYVKNKEEKENGKTK